jgi:hypothetical protein
MVAMAATPLTTTAVLGVAVEELEDLEAAAVFQEIQVEQKVLVPLHLTLVHQ